MEAALPQAQGPLPCLPNSGGTAPVNTLCRHLSPPCLEGHQIWSECLPFRYFSAIFVPWLLHHVVCIYSFSSKLHHVRFPLFIFFYVLSLRPLDERSSKNSKSGQPCTGQMREHEGTSRTARYLVKVVGVAWYSILSNLENNANQPQNNFYW